MVKTKIGTGMGAKGMHEFLSNNKSNRRREKRTLRPLLSRAQAILSLFYNVSVNAESLEAEAALKPLPTLGTNILALPLGIKGRATGNAGIAAAFYRAAVGTGTPA